MFTQKIHVGVIFLIFTRSLLIGQPSSVIDGINTVPLPRCTLSITSSPLRAEIYLDKRPEKKISPDGYSPKIFKNINKPKMSVTLFKKGYSDTTLLLDLSSATFTNIDISMVPLHVQALQNQERFIKARLRTRLGKSFFISSPAFIVGGAVLLYFADQNSKSVEEARSDLNNSIIQTGPKFKAMQQHYLDETKQKNIKFIAGVTLLSMAAVSLGAGIILYF
jgi:hypothetical protein